MPSMATARDAARDSALAPEPFGLVAVFITGLAAVLFLPTLATHLPHAGGVDQARWALTGLGVLILLAAYVALVGLRRGFSRSWAAWTCAYGAGLVIVKFILSPSAFSKTHGKSLSAFVTTGIVVMLLYGAALIVIEVVAGRHLAGWSVGSKVGLAVILAAAAVGARLASAVILGTTSTYLHGLSRGSGFVLPAVVVLASIAVMQSYQAAGPRLKEAFSVSVVLVITWHALWVVYMYRLFG